MLIKLKKVSAKLSSDFSNASSEYKKRELLFFEILENNNVVSIGEASPLGGFCKENIDDIESLFNQFKDELLSNINPVYSFDELVQQRKFLCDLKQPKATRFAVEMALIKLSASKQKISVAEILVDWINAFENKRLSWSSLFLNSAKVVSLNEDLSPTILEGVGSKLLKLKVNGRNVNDSIRRINAIGTYFPNSKIRLDFNRSGSPTNLIEILSQCNRSFIQFVEEPFAELSEESILSLKEHFPEIKIAVDESFLNSNLSFEEFYNAFCFDIFVLKPTAIGGFSELYSLMLKLEKSNINFMLSSLLESDLTLDFHEQVNHFAKIRFGDLLLESGLGTRGFVRVEGS